MGLAAWCGPAAADATPLGGVGALGNQAGLADGGSQVDPTSSGRPFEWPDPLYARRLC